MMNDRFPDRNSRRAPAPSAERDAEGSAGRRGVLREDLRSDGRRPPSPGPGVSPWAWTVTIVILAVIGLILLFL